MVEMAAAVAGIGGAMFYAVGAPTSQVFGPALVRRAPGAGRLALTFDDGPSESTPAVLEALARHGARATFFFCGANVLRLPEIARRAAAEGHQMGNHTYGHPRLFLRTRRQIAKEIGDTQQAIEQVTGSRPELFRPPYGIRWFGLYPALRQHQLRAVMWSACVFDWSRPADQVEAGLRTKAADGAVVLLHDGDGTAPGDRRAGTARAVDRVLPFLADRGLRCVTVSELFA